MRVPEKFFEALRDAPETHWLAELKEYVSAVYQSRVHGDRDKWEAALNTLPSGKVKECFLDVGPVGCRFDDSFEPVEYDLLEANLRAFHPWRKGPFQIGDLYVDTEWRSDWKWERLKNAIEPLKHHSVLDIGCGSGYHLWRMLGQGAGMVVGLEPVDVYVYQFQCIQHFLGYEDRAAVLGIPFEDFPQDTQFFDTIFSMGVLYHRKSPIEHLEAIRQSLRPGGQVVLETLVIEGDEQAVLMPEKRYAQMRNVWFLPSVKMLIRWMKRLRFVDVELVDLNWTSLEEQRSTDWMRFDSLPNFLDPNDPTKTLEGYPAPLRATVVAKAP